MTRSESTLIEKVLENQEEFIESLHSVEHKIDSISLAIYGSEENDQPGLVAKQKHDEERWAKLQPVFITMSVLSNKATWISILILLSAFGLIKTGVLENII
jgi:hypothetical protein